MASGCIVGDCWICNDLVYEDEVDFIADHLVHYECKAEYKGHKEQYQTLMKVYKKQIKCLEKMVEELERIYNELEEE